LNPVLEPTTGDNVAKADASSPGPEPLTAAEELQLQQLRQARFWFDKAALGGAARAVDSDAPPPEVPAEWQLTKGITLHDWQERCVDAWFANERKGIIKVVTGAGKTILALGIAERLQRTGIPDLRVAIVVPTIVLLDQWHDEILARGNLPPGAIGRVGGGYGDTFDAGTRILICVLNSASTRLADEVARAGVGGSLLLIVDECHRAGSAEMKRVFRTERACSLGLSATPERDDEAGMDGDGDAVKSDDAVAPAFEETVLGRELGPVIFEMNYAEAIARGVLPPFKIIHYGLSLRPDEEQRYGRMSREISDLRSSLERHGRRGLELIRWCRSRGAAGNAQASRLLGLTAERKRLLYGMSERGAAVSKILSDSIAQNPECKAILFHESISEVMAIFHALRRAGHRVVAEHSEFPDAMRAESLRLFRSGTARIIVSARSLIEGFNVPSADLGIVVAASASVRQRVQTLGRLLRKGGSAAGGQEKQAVLYVLYAHDTVDELIYEKTDWAQFVGADRNDYFVWRTIADTDPLPQTGPPRSPQAEEEAVDPATLKPGDIYPANPDQGKLYTVDSQWTVRTEGGDLVKPSAQLKAILSSSKKALGKFRVTPKNLLVLKLEKGEAGWHGLYLGRLDAPLEASDVSEADTALRPGYSPGDPYPLGNVKGLPFSVLTRDPRLIALKVRGGVRFVLPLPAIADLEKRRKTSALQERLKKLKNEGRGINRLTVTAEGHVVYVFDGAAYYLGEAPDGAEGFTLEEMQ
jgi:superfamily II DNA or RNA helicase